MIRSVYHQAFNSIRQPSTQFSSTPRPTPSPLRFRLIILPPPTVRHGDTTVHCCSILISFPSIKQPSLPLSSWPKLSGTRNTEHGSKEKGGAGGGRGIYGDSHRDGIDRTSHPGHISMRGAPEGGRDTMLLCSGTLFASDGILPLLNTTPSKTRESKRPDEIGGSPVMACRSCPEADEHGSYHLQSITIGTTLAMKSRHVDIS